MTGKIFDVSGKVGGARSPHPHVLVVEIGDDFILVPAYTSGGYEIEQYKQHAFGALGVRSDQACVELNNAVHVRFYDGRSGNIATWVVERFDRWPRRDLPAPVGEMDDAGLCVILTALVDLTAAMPNRFSPNLSRRLRKTLSDLQSRLHPPRP